MLRACLVPVAVFWWVLSGPILGQLDPSGSGADTVAALTFRFHPAALGLGTHSDQQGDNPTAAVHFRGAFSAGFSGKRTQGHITLETIRGSGPTWLRAMEAGFDRRYGQGLTASRWRGRWDVQILPSVSLSVGRDTLHDGWGRRSLFRGRHAAPAAFLETAMDGGGRLRYRHRVEGLQGNPSMFCWTGEQGDPRFWTPPQGAVRSGIVRMVVAHRLEVDFGRRLTGALWGAVVWNTTDGDRSFEPHYLMPLTSLRPTEYAQGSSDNALVGLEGRLKVGALDDSEKFLYGQLLLDELIVAEILGSTGWWGNKYALLGGICWNYPTGGWRVELSGARPWTYSHFTPTSAYIHGLTPLAHPLGANFFEASAEGRWERGAWQVHGRLTASRRGDDPSGGVPTGSLPQIGDIQRTAETYDWLNGSERDFFIAQIDISRNLSSEGLSALDAFVRAEFRSLKMEEQGDISGLILLGLRSTGPWFGADW